MEGCGSQLYQRTGDSQGNGTFGQYLRDAYHYFAGDNAGKLSGLQTGENPVQRLIRAMGEFEKDAAGYVYRPVEGTMEIEALSQSYEHMVRKIQKLMNQVRQEEISLGKQN